MCKLTSLPRALIECNSLPLQIAGENMEKKWVLTFINTKDVYPGSTQLIWLIIYSKLKFTRKKSSRGVRKTQALNYSIMKYAVQHNTVDAALEARVGYAAR